MANYLLTPIKNFKELKAKVGRELQYYSHVITSPHGGRLSDEARPIIRRLAVELEEKYLLVPSGYVLTRLKIIPKKEAVISAKGSMIRISNSIGDNGSTDANMLDLMTIYTKLDIDELDERNNQKYATAKELFKLIDHPCKEPE